MTENLIELLTQFARTVVRDTILYAAAMNTSERPPRCQRY